MFMTTIMSLCDGPMSFNSKLVAKLADGLEVGLCAMLSGIAVGWMRKPAQMAHWGPCRGLEAQPCTQGRDVVPIWSSFAG